MTHRRGPTPSTRRYTQITARKARTHATRRSVSHWSTSPQDLLEDALPDEQTPKKKKKKSKKKPLNWKSNNIDLYVNESMTAANEIKAVVEKMKENLQKAETILETWSAQPLLKRSGKAQPVDDFEQLQKVTLKERYDVIKKVRDAASVSEPYAVDARRLHRAASGPSRRVREKRGRGDRARVHASAPRRAATRSIC